MNKEQFIEILKDWIDANDWKASTGDRVVTKVWLLQRIDELSKVLKS